MSQVVQQEAMIKILIEKGIFTDEDFWEMVRGIDGEIKGRKRGK